QARLDVGALPRAVRPTADSDLVALRAMLDRAAPPDSVTARAGLLVQHIATVVGGGLETFPARPPSLARGAAVYQEQCTQCHGPLAATLSVRPPTLRDLAVQGRFTDRELEQLLLQGRPGTAMPGFARTLNPGDAAKIVAFLRVLPTAERQKYQTSPAAATFSVVRRQLDSGVALRSDKITFDAYLTFEQVETDVRVKNPVLAN